MVQLSLYGDSGARQMSFMVTFWPSYVATRPSMSSCRSSTWLVMVGNVERNQGGEGETNKSQFQGCSCSSHAKFLSNLVTKIIKAHSVSNDKILLMIYFPNSPLPLTHLVQDVFVQDGSKRDI